MDENKLFIRKHFLISFGTGMIVILLTAMFARQTQMQMLGEVSGVLLLGAVNIFVMRSILQYLQQRVHKTQRIVEESFTQELKEYTKKLEDETVKLQEMTDFLNSILDSSTEYSIITTGKDGKITLFNKGAERLIGYDAEDVLNKETPLLFLRGTSSRSFAQIAVQIMKYGVDEGEWQVIRKDVDTRTMIFTMTPMKNRNGKMLGFLGIAKDVTEQKKLEKQLQDYTENLEQIVEKRTQELEKKNRTLFLANETN